MPKYTDKSLNCKELLSVYKNEMELLHVVGDMYERGIKVDVLYVMEALEYERKEIASNKEKFRTETGREYQDSPKLFKEIFDLRGEEYGRTEKGNPSFTSEILEALNTPTANIINTIRHHEKREGTYWSSFLHFADSEGILRASAGQSNTSTGRFSYRAPNLQNLQKDDNGQYKIRRSFCPRNGNAFVSVDYQAMEYRLMIDYANEKSLIQQVNEGVDVHQATANMLGVSRKIAKTTNFALLYGSGIDNLAALLEVSVKEARHIKELYFGRLPSVKRFMTEVMQTASSRGYIQNWLGRRLWLGNFDFAYKMPNHLIQSSAADVAKMAMVRTSGLAPLILQVHDELVFEMPPNKFAVLPEIARVMESIYKPRNGLGLKIDMTYSFKSFAAEDMVSCEREFI